MNQSINLGQLTKILSDLLMALPRLAPILLALILTLRLMRDVAVKWRAPVDMPAAQAFAWWAAGIAALAYAGVKL